MRPEYSNDTIFTIALVVKTLFRGKTMDITLILSEASNFEPYMVYVWLGLFCHHGDRGICDPGTRQCLVRG